MKLSDIFNQLTVGELSQLGLGGAKSGAIAEADYPKILGHVNLGLTDLFSRFTIRQGQMTIALQPDKISYPLHSAYAVNNPTSLEPVKYILDSPEEPFQDDINKVERVLTDAGYELGINIEGDSESVFTPNTTMLRLPKVMVGAGDKPDYLKTTQLEIHYRASHPVIRQGAGVFNPAEVEVALPYVYLQALLYFIASRAHNPTGMTNEFHSGNSYAMKYAQECARLSETNLEVRQQRENNRLERNGWV